MEEQLEEQELPSTRGVGIKYGAISGLLGIISLVVIDFAGLVGNSTVSTVSSLVITILVVILAHREYKEAGDGMMNYGEGVKVGVWLSLIGAFISAAFLVLYAEVINPTYMEAIEQQQIIAMEEQGMSDDQIEQAMEMGAAFRTPAVIGVFGFIMGFIWSFVMALIISAFTKKSRPEFA